MSLNLSLSSGFIVRVSDMRFSMPLSDSKIISKVGLSLDRKLKLSRPCLVSAFDFRARSNPIATIARLVYSAAAKTLSRLHLRPFRPPSTGCRHRNSLTRNRPLMYESCSNRNLFGVVTRRTWNLGV